MENSPWLWAREGVGCKSKKLKKSQEERQNNLAEMEESLMRFKQSSLIACNQQLSRGAAAVSSHHHKLQIKIAV